MNKTSQEFSLTESKIQAQILLKNFLKPSKKLTPELVVRINALELLITAAGATHPQLKHALSVIADEYGFLSWSNLKTYFTLTGLTKFEPLGGGFFNQWFSSYKEAKQVFSGGNGYLLPYKNQMFICEAGYIEHIGLDSLDHAWQKIGYNWIEPVDLNAWRHLNDLYLSSLNNGLKLNKEVHHG